MRSAKAGSSVALASEGNRIIAPGHEQLVTDFDEAEKAAERAGEAA